MILVPCPHCGPRNASEFRYVGEPHTRPDPATASPQQWNSYLYLKTNVCGWQQESWYHRNGCRKYFAIERNTLTNEIRTPERSADGADSDMAGVAVGANVAEAQGSVDATATSGPTGAP